MTLSIRLEAILSVMENTPGLADIGTDHGFLPIEAVRRGLAGKAVAMDLREGPLARAKAHIAESDLEEKIETRLSDGLAALNVGEAETVVIAGMGGDLISEILLAAAQRNDRILESTRQLILQPQSEWEKVRRVLPQIGFRSVKEKMVVDREKVYWIWQCKPGVEIPDKRWQWVFGSYLAKTEDPLWRTSLSRQLSIRRELLEKLEKNPTRAARERIGLLRREIEDMTEALAYGNDSSEDR